jgi:hypothetical protein
MILKIFSPKKLAFLTQNKAKICKMLIITLVFEKNANFFAESCDHNIDPWPNSNPGLLFLTRMRCPLRHAAIAA